MNEEILLDDEDLAESEDVEPVVTKLSMGEGGAGDVDAIDFLLEQSENRVKPKPWMTSKRFVLGTIDNLKQIIDECIASGKYALDVEGTGLDNRVQLMPSGHYQTYDKIVGVCLSPDGEVGYYIPLRHAKMVEGQPVSLDCNVPLHIFDAEFMRLIEATEAGKTVAIFHNAKYDQEMLQFNETGHPWGEWDKPSTWHDTLILAYMRNTRARRKGLKELAEAPPDADPEKHPCGGPGLGMEMIHIHELWGHDTKRKDFKYDFSTLDPTDEAVLWYACSDAICTWLLLPVLLPVVTEPDTDGKNMTMLYAVEKGCVAATRWMERNRIHVDREKLAELIALGQTEWWESIQEVYAAASEALGRDVMPPVYKTLAESFVANDMNNLLDQQLQIASSRNKGYKPSLIEKGQNEWPATYDVASPAQLGKMFDELGVEGLKVSEKSGQIVTKKEELDKIIEEQIDKFPFLRKVKRFRAVSKALSTFLYPMYLDCDPTDHTMRISFQGHKIDTGRFATPAKEDPVGGGKRPMMKGWPQVNVQATPNVNDPDRPKCMLRIRECFTARPVPVGQPPRFIVAIDYSGVELRIVTNLSREPKWISEFFRCSSCDRRFESLPRPPMKNGRTSVTPVPPPVRCPNCGSDKIGDLHTLTAIAIYGEEAQNKPNWKALRGDAKGVNFALCYGGGPSAVTRAVKSKQLNPNESARIKQTYDRTYAGLKAWWVSQHKFARQHKYVRTAFNRKYPLPDINNPDGGFRSKAERNAVNGPVQGCLKFDSRVPTDKGTLRVDDLHHEKGPFRVWTGKAWVDARTMYSGKKQLTRTNLHTGRMIETSPDHRFRIWRQSNLEWVTQNDLQVGEWVAVNAEAVDYPTPEYHFDNPAGESTHNAKGFSFHGNNPILWEFLGMVYGDGSIKPESIILHCGDNDQFAFSGKAYAEEWVQKLNETLGVQAILQEGKRAEGDTRKSVWRVGVFHKAFRRFCREILGVGDQNTYTKRFPEAIWRESLANRAAFLRGYFSSDGACARAKPGKDAGRVSVRSVNEGLLRDTQRLLNTMGIRASCRVSSKRVDVLDREKFRDLIGYNVRYKQARLEAIRSGYYAHQRHALPPDLVATIGKVIRSSTLYRTLTSAEQSAVLRLVAGSGSKPQCLRYLKRMDPNEVPAWIMEALRYDYEKVVSKKTTDEWVEMYDLEVFDDEHAFVCEGVIVHNSSADITKIAMALIHKECKQRGWLDKVCMVITMHDELVFEIDADVIEEAIPVLVNIMTANDAVLSLNWPIPLTSDVEIGYGWDVPWDLNGMTYGEVKFIGNKKYKSPKDLPEGVSWDSLPSWPEALRPWFKAASGETPTTTLPTPTTTTMESTPAETPADQPVIIPSNVPKVTLPPPGEVYTYRMRGPLSLKSAQALGQLLYECSGQGTRSVRILSRSGEPIDGWLEAAGIKDLKIDATTFDILARRKKL